MFTDHSKDHVTNLITVVPFIEETKRYFGKIFKYPIQKLQVNAAETAANLQICEVEPFAESKNVDEIDYFEALDKTFSVNPTIVLDL